ncbi:GPI mannosyltransferase [Chlamydoabsidia padenii]|nr:GPI mannosyltransferase [Chlamydoabsidia padenii]
MGKGFLVCYGVLLWLRWMMASLPGYVHPDEFFQSPEITARAILKVDTLIPWEFQPDHAARSILIPFLTTGLPFWLMTLAQQWFNVVTEVQQTLTLFLVERSACFGLTLVTDYVVYRLCQRLGKDEVLPLLFVATSQVTMVYNTRPFSNAIESVILSLSLLALVNFDGRQSSGFGMGCLISAGLFTRITFLLYGFPIGLAFLYLAR